MKKINAVLRLVIYVNKKFHRLLLSRGILISFNIFGAVNLHHDTQLDTGIQDQDQPLRVVLTDSGVAPPIRGVARLTFFLFPVNLNYENI